MWKALCFPFLLIPNTPLAHTMLRLAASGQHPHYGFMGELSSHYSISTSFHSGDENALRCKSNSLTVHWHSHRHILYSHRCSWALINSSIPSPSIIRLSSYRRSLVSVQGRLLVCVWQCSLFIIGENSFQPRGKAKYILALTGNISGALSLWVNGIAPWRHCTWKTATIPFS